MNRAERCRACGRPTSVGEDFDGPCVYESDLECALATVEAMRREGVAKDRVEYRRAVRKAWLEKRRAAGVCIHCSQKAEDGYSTCRECFKKSSFKWSVLVKR